MGRWLALSPSQQQSAGFKSNVEFACFPHVWVFSGYLGLIPQCKDMSYAGELWAHQASSLQQLSEDTGWIHCYG